MQASETAFDNDEAKQRHQQPVDWCTGCRCKCKYRRLLINGENRRKKRKGREEGTDWQDR